MHQMAAASLALTAVLLAGCTIAPESNSSPTASAQLLEATAADKAAAKLAKTVPSDEKVFVDAAGLGSVPDKDYAIAAVEAALQRQGDVIVPKRKVARLVVELRGALGINDGETLLGIPATSFGAPMTGSISVPKIALYDDVRETGVALFRATSVNAKTGKLAASDQPVFGYSHDNRYTAFFMFSWTRKDIIPKADRNPGISILP